MSECFGMEDGMFKVYKRSFPYYGRIYPALIACVFLGLMQGVLALVEPQIIALMVDRVLNPALGMAPQNNRSIFMFLIEDIPENNLWQIMGVLSIIFGVFLVLYFITFYIRWNMAHYFSIGCDNNLRLGVLKKINGFGPGILKDYTSGDLITIVNSDAGGIREFHIATIPFIIDSLFYILVALVFLAKTSIYLTLLPILTLGIYFFITKGFLRLCNKIYDEMWNKSSAFNSETQESIYGIRTIKSYGREDVRRKSFYKKTEELRDFYSEFGKKRYRYFMFFDGADQVVMLVSMAISIALAVNFKMSSGEYTAFLTYLLAICGSFVEIIFLASDVQEQKVSADRLYGLLDKKDEVAKKYGSNIVSEKPNIDIRNLTVTADGEPLIKNINLSIPYGKKVGIMGKIGCGKSVLIRTMQAFKEYESGELLFDGVNSREYSRESIAKAFSYAMQDVFLFSNTIESNIAYYNPDAEDEQIIKCGRAAEVDEFASKFDEGYRTIIGEKGFGLSGGQKQRVAIARALLKDAPIIVLDDCTSALDIETESKIFKNLEEFFHGKSIVMATHRAKALKDFDEILYMDNGEIVERGTFDELMELDGYYAGIYKQQMDKEVFAVE